MTNSENAVFIKNTILTFSSRVIITLCTFLTSIIIARNLGPEGKGILSILITLLALFIQFGNLGLHSANTYFAAKNMGLIKSIIGNTVFVGLTLGILISILVLLLYTLKQDLFGGISFDLLLLICIATPFSLIYLLGLNIFLGLQKINNYNTIEISKNALFLFCVVAMLGILKQGTKTAVAIYTIINILFGFFIIVFLSKKFGLEKNFNYELFSNMFTYGIKVYIACLLAYLVLRFNFLIINYYLNPAAVGYYSVATQITELIYMLPAVVGTLIFPKLSGMTAGKKELTKKVLYVIAAVVLVICLTMWIISKGLINFIYGTIFSPAYVPLVYLLPGIWFYSMVGILSQWIASINMPLYGVIIWFPGLIINIYLSVQLVPIWGIKGAAIANTISYFVIFVLHYVYFLIRKDYGLQETV